MLTYSKVILVGWCRSGSNRSQISHPSVVFGQTINSRKMKTANLGEHCLADIVLRPDTVLQYGAKTV